MSSPTHSNILPPEYTRTSTPQFSNPNPPSVFPPWQRCPVCWGKGIVPHGFYSTPMAASQATSTAPEQCRSCHGRGIVR